MNNWISKFRNKTGRYENEEFISDFIEFCDKESKFWSDMVDLINQLEEGADLEDFIKVLPVYADNKLNQYYS